MPYEVRDAKDVHSQEELDLIDKVRYLVVDENADLEKATHLTMTVLQINMNDIIRTLEFVGAPEETLNRFQTELAEALRDIADLTERGHFREETQKAQKT